MKPGLRGIFVIAATPFGERGDLLYDELARHVDWIVRAGSHGVVWPVNYSEVTWLSPEERHKGSQIVVDAVAGRVPVVVGVSGAWKSDAAAYARRAAEVGADAVIAILRQGYPSQRYPLVRDYYRTIADAAGLPVFVQNQGSPWPGLSADTVVRLCRDIDLVQYVKEEKPPQGRSTQEIMDLGQDVMHGVFSGSGCTWLMSDMARGISGCMPGAPMPDICAQIWDLYHAGDVTAARDLQSRLSAYQTIWRGMARGARKHVLVRRGIISTPFMRQTGCLALDGVEDAELEVAIDLLRPYFRV